MRERHPIQINCQKCGKSTIVGSGAGKFCKDCYHQIKLEKNKEYMRRLRTSRRKSLNLVCQNCGSDLSGDRWGRKYCSACRKPVAQKRNAEYYQANKEKRLEYSRQYYSRGENKERHREQALKSYHKNKVLM
jgi:RNase P subunit RPR2